MTPVGLGTPRRTDVVVVGGGVNGSAAAWALARRGVGVVLLERCGPGHARGSAHGRAWICRSAELEAETGTTLVHPASGVDSAAASEQVDADAAVAALQAAASRHDAVVRHHRRVDAVEAATDGGVLVRQAGGATIRARATVVTAGACTADALGDGIRLPPLRDCPVVTVDAGREVDADAREFAAQFSGHGFTSVLAIGRVLADLTLGFPAGAEPFAPDAHAVLR